MVALPIRLDVDSRSCSCPRQLTYDEHLRCFKRVKTRNGWKFEAQGSWNKLSTWRRRFGGKTPEEAMLKARRDRRSFARGLAP